MDEVPSIKETPMFVEQFDDVTEGRIADLARRFGLDPIRDRFKLTHLIFDVGLAFVESAASLAEAKSMMARVKQSGQKSASGDWVGRDPND